MIESQKYMSIKKQRDPLKMNLELLIDHYLVKKQRNNKKLTDLKFNPPLTGLFLQHQKQNYLYPLVYQISV